MVIQIHTKFIPKCEENESNSKKRIEKKKKKEYNDKLPLTKGTYQKII